MTVCGAPAFSNKLIMRSVSCVATMRLCGSRMGVLFNSTSKPDSEQVASVSWRKSRRSAAGAGAACVEAMPAVLDEDGLVAVDISGRRGRILVQAPSGRLVERQPHESPMESAVDLEVDLENVEGLPGFSATLTPEPVVEATDHLAAAAAPDETAWNELRPFRDTDRGGFRLESDGPKVPESVPMGIRGPSTASSSSSSGSSSLAALPPITHEIVGDVEVDGFDRVRPIAREDLRARIDAAVPRVPAALRARFADDLHELLDRTDPNSSDDESESEHGNFLVQLYHRLLDAVPEQHEDPGELWAGAISGGVTIGDGDTVLHVGFTPIDDPATAVLDAPGQAEPGRITGTSTYAMTSFTEYASKEKNIGVGVLLDFFTAAVGKATFLSPGFVFVPRKQLRIESLREVETIGGSRLMDSARSTYSSGTRLTVTVVQRDQSPYTEVIDLPEHEVGYSVRAVGVPTAPTDPLTHEAPSLRVVSSDRLSKYPFGLTKLDARPVIAEIGRALLDAGYTGDEVAEAVEELTEETFNADLARRFNQVLLDGTHRSGLIEVAHVLGNVRISLELLTLQRKPDLRGGDASVVRVDIGDRSKTDDARFHGYDAPLEVELLANVFGVNVGGGGIGFETQTMYGASTAEQNFRKFAASFGGDVARYATGLRVTVTFDTDSRLYLKRQLNPVARRRPVRGFSTDGIPGEIVLPAEQAAAFEGDVTSPKPDYTPAADHVVRAFQGVLARVPSVRTRELDGVSLTEGGRRLLQARPSALADLAGPVAIGYRYGALGTNLPAFAKPADGWRGTPKDLVASRAFEASRGAITALIGQAAAGPVQLVVQDPDLVDVLRAEVEAAWPTTAQADEGGLIAAALQDLEARRGPDGMRIGNLVVLLLTNPNIRIVDADGVLITRHNPSIPAARQYVITAQGNMLRSVRTVPGPADANGWPTTVYSDAVMTPLYKPEEGGATLQLATRSGTGPSVTPVAPGLADVLRYIERAMATLIDSRNDAGDPWRERTDMQGLQSHLDARVRTEIMNKIATYFGTARMRSRFNTLITSGLRIGITVKRRWFWQAPRRFEIEVRGFLLDRLDGGTAETQHDVAVDLQAEGNLETAKLLETEAAVMISGDAEIAIEFTRRVGLSLAEIDVEVEAGKVGSTELTANAAVFNRLIAPAGPADRPEYRVRYGIAITEFDTAGRQVDRWTRGVYEQIAPVVPHAFQHLPAGPVERRARITAFARGLEEFWEIDPATAQRLRDRRLRFDRIGASGVVPHFANLDKLTEQALKLVDEHDARHGIVREPEERVQIERRIRDAFDEAYFASHFARLTGANGMTVALPWARRILPRKTSVHEGWIPDIKSSLGLKLTLLPPSRAVPATASDAATMSRRHYQSDAQQNAGWYGSLFVSVIGGPRLRLGALTDSGADPDLFDAINPVMPELRGELVAFKESHQALGADDFTMVEDLTGGTTVASMSAVVEITVNTRFSKHRAVSTARSYFLGDGTTQLELPTGLYDRLQTRDPLTAWQPAPPRSPGARRPISARLVHDSAHVHVFVPGDEVAVRGGVVGWVAGLLRDQELIDDRFLSSTDVGYRQLQLTYDEVSLAGQLPDLMTVGVPVDLDLPLLGDRRVTLLLKGTSVNGPEYVRSSGTGRATTGGRSLVETGTAEEREYATGLGINIQAAGVLNAGRGDYLEPNAGVRRDVGGVIGKEKLTTAEELRRVTGRAPDNERNPTTDDFLTRVQLTLEIYTDWIPAEPLRFLTAGAKQATAPLARLMAAVPAHLEPGERPHSLFTLNDAAGLRTPVLTRTLPGEASAAMTVDRLYTQPATDPATLPAEGERESEPEDGYVTRMGPPEPGPLNRALAPLMYGAVVNNIVRIQQHVKYATADWNVSDALHRKLLTPSLTGHRPVKEASLAPTGNKGRQMRQALRPRVVRSNLPKVFTHAYTVVPRGKKPGVDYGFEADGIARPLPRERGANKNPMFSMLVSAEESETETSFQRSAALQSWFNPLAGGAPADGQPMLPHVASRDVFAPSSALAQHAEENVRFEEDQVLYRVHGQDMLNGRGVTFALRERGSLDGSLRYSDAVQLAALFPDQFVHPDAITVTTPEAVEALEQGFNQTTGDTVHVLTDQQTHAAVQTVAEQARQAQHTVHVAVITQDPAGGPERLTTRSYLPLPLATTSVHTTVSEDGEDAVSEVPARHPHVEVDRDGIPWASSNRSAFTESGDLIPQEQRACVEVTVVALAGLEW
jgi:hypothetical protein